MKKTIAAGSASLLGLTAVALGASSAQAADDPVVTPCVDHNDHNVTTGGVSSNWYMDCIPQYAFGQVEFDITSATPFPAAFVPLGYPAVTSTATVGTVGLDYFGLTAPPAGFGLVEEGAVTPNSRSYGGTMIFPIASVGHVDIADLPDGCSTGTYTDAYVVNYTPATVTFTQTIDGEDWVYQVSAAPAPLYLGLSILDTGVFDPTGSMCASGNGVTTFALDNVANVEWENVAQRATSFGDGETLMPYFGDGKTLPDIARTPNPPALASTGVDPSGALGVAALFLALGVAGGYLRRRQLARD